MGEQIIVGAGLSGMVAAINLAREGRDVLVREQRDRVGGATTIKGFEGKTINIGDGTAFNSERLSAYTKVDLSGQAVPVRVLHTHVYGKYFDVETIERATIHLVERGARPTSLDVYLYELAKSTGVRFQFNDIVTDFDELPPDTILATGLFQNAYRNLEIPYVPVYGHFGMDETEDESPRVVLYFDEYTRDYGFYTQINGARGAVVFSRGKPLDNSVKERFEQQLAENDGIEFNEWFPVDIGMVPVKQPDNPRLFAKNFILAGTLSGTMDPVFLFGVHGALISGKIAAIAVSDHRRALEEFARINKYYRLYFMLANLYLTTPTFLLKHAAWAVIKLYPYTAELIGDNPLRLLPGYGRI